MCQPKTNTDSVLGFFFFFFYSEDIIGTTSRGGARFFRIHRSVFFATTSKLQSACVAQAESDVSFGAILKKKQKKWPSIAIRPSPPRRRFANTTIDTNTRRFAVSKLPKQVKKRIFFLFFLKKRTLIAIGSGVLDTRRGGKALHRNKREWLKNEKPTLSQTLFCLLTYSI